MECIVRYNEYKMQSLFLFQNIIYTNVSFVRRPCKQSIYLFIFYSRNTSFLREQNREMKEFSWNYIHNHSYLIQHCVRRMKKKNVAESSFSHSSSFTGIQNIIFMHSCFACLGTFINVVIYEFTETFSFKICLIKYINLTSLPQIYRYKATLFSTLYRTSAITFLLCCTLNVITYITYAYSPVSDVEEIESLNVRPNRE